MADGSYPRNQWAWINGAVYHFNEIGYMTEGRFAENGRWYYLNTDGSIAIGRVQEPNSAK